MVNKYTFEVSYQKTIIAKDEVSALKVLNGKLQTVSENKKVKLIEKGVFNDTK